jgi:hypothetical protein
MENQIKVGSVVSFKMPGGRYDFIDFIVRKADANGANLCYYSPVTGKFEDLDWWAPLESLVLVEKKKL